MKIMGHIIRWYGLGIPDPCKLGVRCYSTASTKCGELVTSLLRGTELYVGHRTCMRKTNLEDRKDWDSKETEAQSRRKYKVGI